MKKENKKPNMLKALKIKVVTLNDDKKFESRRSMHHSITRS